jgi:hypothetical protein
MLLVSVIVSLAIGAVAGQSRITNEDYEIYGLVLTEFLRDGKRIDPDKHFVIASKTRAFDPTMVEKKKASLYRSFNNRNKAQESLESRFPVRFPYSLADEQEILGWAAQDAAEFHAEQERLSREGKPLRVAMCGPGWKRFSVRFPKSEGYYRISQIGFSHDHRRAFLEVEGKGSGWERNSSYWLRWKSHGWEIYQAGGGGGVC